MMKAVHDALRDLLLALLILAFAGLLALTIYINTVPHYVGTGYMYYTDDYVDEHYSPLKVMRAAKYDQWGRDIKVVRLGKEATEMMYFVRIKDGQYIEEQDYLQGSTYNVWVVRHANHAFVFECVLTGDRISIFDVVKSEQ